MPSTPQDDFRTTELDLDLVSTRFGVQTNWHVIAGAPSSGKSTLIHQLAGKGFRTISEIARHYFERELAKGRTIDEISEDDAALQRQLMDVQLRLERGLRADDALFLDRAFPDALTFSRIAGLNPNAFVSECFHHRYASVFLLDRFPVEQDGVRFHDDATARFLDEWHARDYGALGYDVVRVPVLSPDERLAFVLETLSGQGLI